MNDLIVEKVFPFLKFEKRRKESPFNFNFSKIFVFEHLLPTHSQLLSRDFKSVTDFSFFIRLDDIDTNGAFTPSKKGFPRGKRKFL